MLMNSTDGIAFKVPAWKDKRQKEPENH